MRRRDFLAALTVTGSGSAYAQTSPDRRGEYTTPDDNGFPMNAPIPRDYHFRNEGGSNGAGLCVIASLIINGASQGLADFHLLKGCKLWRVAKSRPGGYSPQKLAALLNEVYPELQWVSIETDDPNVVRKYSAAGYPIANTMSTGQQYSYMPIHHFISTPHADLKLTCFVDNNDPGVYHWIPASEQNRRFLDGGSGWMVFWPYLKPRYTGWIISSGLVLGGLVLCWSPERNSSS